jgi:putative oxidoreductase
MKKQRILFWVSTGVFSAFMLFSAYNYLAVEGMKAAFTEIGFPDYFRVELGIAKLLGAIVLLLPGIPKLAKQFAYAGFAINLASAYILHASLGDSLATFAPLVFVTLLLGASYYSYTRLKTDTALV